MLNFRRFGYLIIKELEMNMRVHKRYKILQMCISEDELDKVCVFTSGFSHRLASDNLKYREDSSFPNSLKVKWVGKFQQNSH